MKILFGLFFLAFSLYAMPSQVKDSVDVKVDTKDVQNAKEVVTRSGIIDEVIDGGGYSYINVKKDEKKFWIAVAGSGFKKGQQITFIEEMQMSDFKSKALDRVFDKIIFASVVNKSTISTKPKMESIKKVKNGYRVEELYDKRDKLKDKVVKVRGKVVKVSEHIMGKSWVHIQDGSGKGEKSDVIFTSKTQTPQVGDIVIASGKLRVDKDFGYGYKYAVIVEEATFSKDK